MGIIIVAALIGTAGTCAPLPDNGELIRGIYAHPGRALDNRVWATYGSGYETDREEKHGDETSLRCVAETNADAQGAVQQIVFDQDEARPIVVAGWAKLVGVTGEPNYRCSVYLDLRLKNGESWPMKIAAFDPATEGWQYSEETYEPPAPIATALVYAFIRERAGTVWFDDLHVGEVIEGGARGPNLLEHPSFEGSGNTDPKHRDEFFGAIEEIGCNAFHFYRSTQWDVVMDGDELPPMDPDDPMIDFVRDAHERGLKVWLTVGVGLPKIDDANDPDFPVWGCVNNRWGEAYTRAVAYMTQSGVDGIGVVPDEWNTDTHPVRGLSKHADPEVAEFYESITHWCECDECKSRFLKAYGEEFPDIREAWKTDDPIWGQFTEFRYDSTRDWIDRTVKAAKAVNPGIITDTMICVLPVCSDNRMATGAAWDQIGATTELECLQTDPYILLHNYLGDSTHYYPTETALHLGAANFARRSGVTLESCRLRDFERDREPVEVYGSALSCWMHGASEFFWWHMTYVLGNVDYVDPAGPRTGIASTYDVMEAMEPFVAGGEVPGEVLVCYSRRSEDTWDRMARAEEVEGSKRGFKAHRNVIYALLRRGIPFRMTFLEHPDPARLDEAKVLLVPFAYALNEDEVALLEEQAGAGKTVIVMSEVPTGLDERDGVIFLGEDSATGLLEPFAPKGERGVKVALPPLEADHVAALEAEIDQALERKSSLFAEPVAEDVEVTLLESPSARVLLAVNWETESSTTVALDVPVRNGKARGQRILPDGTVEAVETRVSKGQIELELQPQEAVILALEK